ncbi:protein phosphatase 2C domain-containing protein [Kamptonema cortianum]|nr:protein phosphatase 2C domain-containing protein [Geitlerinema splendidum]MDK3156168.1 protein phosphatase 2C domain-containing protein [Kamptonema cortianum]
MDEITAEITIEQIPERPALRIRPRVTVAAKTDMGRVRENNEDKFEYFLPESEGELASKGLIFLVCDGMGGHEAGQIASELACKTFIDVYRNHPSDDAAVAAKSGVAAANRFILDVGRAIPSRRGMGTTLSGLLLVQEKAIIVQVGDSRVYRLRGGELSQLTVDHTWVEETVRAGMLSREEAEQHQYRHVITRALGSEGEVTPDIFIEDIQEGDVYFLCSDGITNHVTDDQIRDALSAYSPSEAMWRLISLALADGGSDNATGTVVRIDELEPVDPRADEPAPEN